MHGSSWRSWTMLRISFKHEKMGPFGKNSSLVNIGFMHFSKNWSTLALHIYLIFHPKRVFLDYSEILGCTLSKLFNFISSGSSMFM